MAEPAVAVLAVDGGGSKTDVALVAADGRLLAGVRGPTCSHEVVGMEHVVPALAVSLEAACERAGVELAPGFAAVGGYCLAGDDLPIDERRLTHVLDGAGWTGRSIIRNDTFAVLRAGSERGLGVAVVCGAGINAAGAGPGGRLARLPALGELSGDLGGGSWLATQGLGAAVRARDGRGERTALEQLVPARLGYGRPSAVLTALRSGRLDYGRLVQDVPPVVLEAASAGDAVAGAIVDTMADEVVTMVRALLRRLGMLRGEPDVVLGGGVFRSNDERLIGRVRAGVERVAPGASVVVLHAPPVVGAALLGLDALGAGAEAAERLRAELGHEVLPRIAGSRNGGEAGMVAGNEEVGRWQG
jgi:N-acetylglucosamine kinase-like BadF-type ATPase